eukprot:3410917-Rhodomonas_salina.1
MCGRDRRSFGGESFRMVQRMWLHRAKARAIARENVSVRARGRGGRQGGGARGFLTHYMFPLQVTSDAILRGGGGGKRVRSSGVCCQYAMSQVAPTCRGLAASGAYTERGSGRWERSMTCAWSCRE